jgi:hypothetical protein
MSDWTRSETISPPDVIVVKYAVELSNGSTEQREQILYSTTRSESISIYDKINYSNADGMPQIAEVAIKKVDTRFTTIASVNQAYVAYRLSKSLGLPIGEAKSENITISEYKTTVSGPVLTRETVLNYDSLAQFAGGLQVQDYSAFQPSGEEMILTHKTERVITLLTNPEGRDITKTETSRWMARGETQEGRNDFSIMYNSFKRFVRENPAIVEGLVRAFVDLVFEGTEVQIETGRIPVPIKPPDQEIIADEVIDYGNSSEREQSLSGARSFGPGGPGSTVQSTFDMPFAPDDYFIFEDGERVLVPGNADDAADCFGRTEAALDAGHAFGHNIVTGWNEIPTLDLSPVYIRQAGLEVAFLTDSTSYAWDGQGMVVSSDLMLLGVTGWYGTAAPATSWAQLPVPVAGLRQVTAGTTGTASKANSTVIPSGFSARNPAAALAALPNNQADSYALFRTQQVVVGPALEVERYSITSGAAARIDDFDYALQLPAEDFSLATGSIVEESFPPVDLAAIVYDQSSVYEDNEPATVETMQDGLIGGSATGTEGAEFATIWMDLGATYTIDRIVIGTATEDMPGGWSKEDTEDLTIVYYTGDFEGEDIGGYIETFPAEGIYTIPVDFEARIILVSGYAKRIALTEFYALAPGQEDPNAES